MDSTPLAASLLCAGLLTGTTCIAWPVQRGCSGSDVHFALWDPIVRAATDTSGMPIWSWFQEGGPLVFLIGAGPALTSVLGFVAVLAVLAAPPSRRVVAPALLAGGLGCVVAGLWGTVQFVLGHS